MSWKLCGLVRIKVVLIVLAALLAGARFDGNASPAGFGQPQKINDGWLFHLGDAPGAAQIDFDASSWRQLDLPHDWSVEGTLSPDLASATGYLPGGIGWYRKTITIPAAAATRDAMFYLYFEGVYNRSEVYVNGQLVGRRPNGYVSFIYDITPLVRPGQPAVVAVRVDHSRYADSRWYTGSGIYRNVWLIAAAPVHIAPWGVFYYTRSLVGEKAALRVATTVANATDTPASVVVTQRLFAAYGSEVAQATSKADIPARDSGEIASELEVGAARLWSLRDPYLYRLRTSVTRDGQIIDSTETTVGIRSLAFDPDKGFALNGEWMKIKGVCIHHDAGVLGAAVPREVWRRRLVTLKSIGVNAIRLSHNPQAPAVYELCDELGLLVLDEGFDEWEFPKRKWLRGWNLGEPGFDGSFDFFAEWGERDMADIVRRDRNHPSIFAWSIGNEVDYPNDPYSHPVLDGSRIGQPMFGGYKPEQPSAERLGAIARRLAAAVRANDPSRPVTAGLAGVVMSNATDYPAALDITGYNYTEDRYAGDHKTYPRRVIFGSETSQSMASWKAVRDNDFIFGQFLWTGIDYLGEARAWPTRGFYSGLLDFGGFIKPRGYFRKALWTTEPTAYLGTYPAPTTPPGASSAPSTAPAPAPSPAPAPAPSIDAWPLWNYAPGQLIRVVCYTNAARARLLLDGREVGAVKPYDDDTGVIWWDVPYKPGKLEVVGMDDKGREICRHAIRSSARPHTLVALMDDDTAILSREKGLAQITVLAVDDKGVPVMLADDEVTCVITGPARLLGMEAGDNTDMGNYRDNRQRLFNGRLLAYVEATGKTGHVNVSFTAPWLHAAGVNLLFVDNLPSDNSH